MSGEMDIVCLGVHVLDVLVRPVDALPEGEGDLVEEIRVTAAGTAGGTALTLAKLGATVHCAGAIGTDAAGDMLTVLLERQGIDASLLVRRDDRQTSASVLPINSRGDRPALHVIGANDSYGADDAPWEAIEAATHVHLGAPEFMGGEAAALILSRAREHGAVTSADLLAPGDPGLLDWVGAALPELDYLLPNRSQVLGFTGASDVAEGARALLERGVGCVAATCGGDGAIVVHRDGVEEVPAFPVEVVDTTGCGDAFSAGFLRGVALGRSSRDAAVLGCAAASLVAQGLGSDHGDFDLAATDALVRLRGETRR